MIANSASRNTFKLNSGKLLELERNEEITESNPVTDENPRGAALSRGDESSDLSVTDETLRPRCTVAKL